MTNQYFPDGWTKDKTFTIEYKNQEPYYIMKIHPILIGDQTVSKIDGHSIKTFNNLYFSSVLNTSFLATNDLTLLIKFIKQHKIASDQIQVSYEIGQVLDLVDALNEIFY